METKNLLDVYGFMLDYHQDTVKSPVSSIYEVSTSKAEAASLLHSYTLWGINMKSAYCLHLVTYASWLLATPTSICLTDSGCRAYEQVGGIAVEPDL